MKSFKENPKSDKKVKKIHFGNIFLPFISIITLTLTFLTAISELDFTKKLLIFLGILLSYVIFCISFYFMQNRQIKAEEAIAEEDIFNEETEKQLLALEEAGRFFGASLRTADMFRLAASRVCEVVPHSASILILNQNPPQNLKIIGANGLNVREMLELGEIPRKGLAGVCLNAKKIKTDEQLRLEKNVFPSENLDNLQSAVAVPLFEQGEKVFAVFVLYGGKNEGFDEKSLQILEAFGERIAPLILGSLAFERNLFNALTDVLTNLPNERAFYMVLENQLAEAQRKREERPLTLLSIDIDNFNELNQKFGHATGDKILAFTAEIIKKQLRKMDFLARSSQDEFLVVLPTATEEKAQEVIERLKRVFQTAPFEITSQEREFLKINIGAATFWKDGETAANLLQTARLKKHTAKYSAESNILWFPKEFVN